MTLKIVAKNPVKFPGEIEFTFAMDLSTPPPAPTPTPAPAPTQAPDYGTDVHWQRHYDYWLPVFTQLNTLPSNGSVTVDTAGQDLDHIMHFVFDALVGTNRTLTVKHQGATYVIRGVAENTANGTMRGIRLGNNYAFSNLKGFRA